MAGGKGLCLSVLCSQPNQIITANTVDFPLTDFELVDVCAAQIREERKNICPCSAFGSFWDGDDINCKKSMF